MLNPLIYLGRGLGWRLRRLQEQGLYRLTFIYRWTLRHTAFVAVTGSAGKTTTKDLIGSILERNLPRGRKSPGSTNWPVELAYLVLGTRRSDAYFVTEIGTIEPGFIDLSLALVRPTVGVVTNIGGDHFSAFRSLDAIAEEKGKLIGSLPADGIAILNADDPRVLAMRMLFQGRVVTYGLAGDAMLRGDTVHSAWPDRLSLTAKWNGESVQVQTQLCGTHWAPAVLAALATGVAMGVPLADAAKALATVKPFDGRMQPVEVGGGVTFIRDDWKAPLWTVTSSFEFMRQARAARKIIVIGTVSDYPGDSARRYVQIGRQALEVADCVLFVGSWASSSLRAKRDPKDELWAFATLREAETYLAGYLRPGDLVLLKGSHRADHLQRLVLARTTGIKCWRADCGRRTFCDTCDLRDVASGPEVTEVASSAARVRAESISIEAGSAGTQRSTVVVVGLGNPGEQYAATPHNVGHRVVDILSRRLAQTWRREGNLVLAIRAQLGVTPICLIKSLTQMNDTGIALLQVADELGFGVGQCVLVHDDADLPIGTIRLRMRGGDGGHQGVRSIIQAFQDDKFRRIKIGVGRPEAGAPVIEYLLTPFSVEQLAPIDEACRAAADRVLELIEETPLSV